MNLQERLENLKTEIQVLRSRLNFTAEEKTFQLKTDEAVEISAKLDHLIAEFLRIQEKLEEKRA